MIKNICCIGAGYVGGPTMSVIALKCPDLNVTIVDSNNEKIKAWNGPLNKLPVYEPGLSRIVKKVRNKNLFFSEDIKSAIQNSEVIFIAVNTPTKTKGEGAGMAADLTFIESCAANIAKYSNSNKIVVEKSTVPIRTAEKINEILSKNNKELSFEILSNPEFLAEGTAISDMINPSRVLIGGSKTDSGEKAVESLVKIYSNWITREKIITTNIWSSELSKLASNAMLAQRISSINSLSALCEKTGADIGELSTAIGMDSRIGKKFLNASVGFGGSCFKKDILNLVYLCKHYGLNEVAEYWHQVVKINEYQKNRFADKILDHFQRDLKGKNIAIFGWAFKSNTNDSRESASISVAKKLFFSGSSITIFDPMVSEETIYNDIIHLWDLKFPEKNKRIQKLELSEYEKNKFDAVAILTEWDQFKEHDFGNKVPVFDGRRILSDDKVKYRLGS